MASNFSSHPTAFGATQRMKNQPMNHSVYVIELDQKVLKHARFRKENPHYQPGKPCFYVGVTACAPDERFLQHAIGYKSCSFVERYGKWLRRRMYERYNPMTREVAYKRERQLAAELRGKAYAVWQK